MKLTMMMVEEGPMLLNLEVPNKGRIRFNAMAGMVVINVPKKQYLIWIRSNPIEFWNDRIKKKIPPDIIKTK